MPRRPQQDTTSTQSIPPPSGMNRADSLGQLPPTDAIHLLNLLSGEYGLRSRLGWRVYTTPGSHGPPRTMLGYAGSTPAEDRLFAVLASGIYEQVAGDAADAWPSAGGAFAVATGDAGWGVGATYTAAGGKFMFYADPENGLFRYEEGPDDWQAVPAATDPPTTGEISGVDPGDLVFCTAWKNRMWFIERNSTRAWYLPVGQVAGVASSFDFGTKLKQGGRLVGLWSWTTDGGIGLDDLLVGVTSAGDVVIYQGTDPDSASSFGLKGIWQVGSVPVGNRIATDSGGDLLLLTCSGLLSLSKLIAGNDKLMPDMYASHKIRPLVQRYMQTRQNLQGWALRQQPEENALLVLLPLTATDPNEQLALSAISKGWSTLRNLPMVCSEVWQGKVYFGNSDGSVCINDGAVDGLRLDGTGATEINWALLQGYYDFGVPKRKQGQMINAHFLSEGMRPGYVARLRYDFDLTEPPFVSVQAETGGVPGWDGAHWDQVLWPDAILVVDDWLGASGMGSHVALEVSGSSMNQVTYLGAHVILSPGGVL